MVVVAYYVKHVRNCELLVKFTGIVQRYLQLRGHRKSSQKPSETDKIRLGGGGIAKITPEASIDRLKPEVKTFVRFRGGVFK